MMKYLPILLIVVLFSWIQTAAGQYYETGQDPASIKWMQVKTGRFDIIFPEKYGKAGIDFASYLDESNVRLTTLFPGRKFRIPVVIHNYSTLSNGYVAWAPKRIELYPTPEQNALPGDQYRLLALHELAHVHQMEALNSGFSTIMSVFFGQQFTGVVSSLLPLWYLEGNAVVAESVLSSSGRGRSASFQRQLKALVTENRYYRYDKINNGSFRDYIPDHYQTGYQMTAWAMVKYDPDIWNKVLKKTGAEPFTINPVNFSLRNNARLTKRRLYSETFDTLRKIWIEELNGNHIDYEGLNPDKKREYINYYSPVFAGSDSVIAIKTTLYSTPAFVLIDPSGKEEKVIHRPGYMYPWLISCGGGKIVWVENRPDPRWRNRDYSIIRMLDLKRGSVRTLSHRSRYLSASISPDGKLISAVENTADNINNLVLIDAGTGEVRELIPSPGNVYIQRPQWSENGREITVIFLTDDGEGIMSLTPGQKEWKTFIAPGRDDLQSCYLRNDSLFYVSSFSGTDNIYLQTPKREIRQLTSSRFGTTDVDVRANKIIFSDYTSRGNEICTTGTGEDFNSKPDQSNSSFLINRLDKQPGPVPDISSPPPSYMAKPYRKWQHLFRFHSWMPFYADLEMIQSDPLAIRPGFTIMSQNSLSTLISTLGYEYSEDKKHVFHSKVTWQGQYPVIQSRVDYGYKPDVYGTPAAVSPGIRFLNEISLPLTFSSGRFTRFLRPSLIVENLNDIYPRETRVFDYTQTDLKGRLIFSNYSRSSHRDIYPRWAQTFDLNYIASAFDRDLFGSSAFVKTTFFFPGLLRNNSIRIRFEAEKQEQAKFLFGNRVSFPRGFDRFNSPEGYGNIVSRELIYSSVDYFFPIAYPDFNVSSLLYLKRIRSGLFYDHASGTGNRYINPPGSNPAMDYHNFTETFESFGVELLADFHLLRIPFMISGGIQSAWKDFGSAPVINVLFNIDLYGFSLGKRQEKEMH